jgi:hypothetical protein
MSAHDDKMARGVSAATGVLLVLTPVNLRAWGMIDAITPAFLVAAPFAAHYLWCTRPEGRKWPLASLASAHRATRPS